MGCFLAGRRFARISSQFLQLKDGDAEIPRWFAVMVRSGRLVASADLLAPNRYEFGHCSASLSTMLRMRLGWW